LNSTFNYSYDKLNRLTSAAATGLGESISYDVMGNITSLTRDNFGTNTYSSYSGNQLTGISGFTKSNYDYDLNGNMTRDSGKDIYLSYNLLNLPSGVSGSQTMSYTYDATGNKLKRTAGNEITDYVGGIQYKNGAIEFVQTEVGIARNNSGSYSYEYNLTDHLGNNRATFYQNPGNHNLEVLQRDDYYAFGLRKGVQGGNNQYLYNGKELQDELNPVGGQGGQYDFESRFHDPVIARFTTIDPLADEFDRISPYNYAMNNPIRYIDPDGMAAIDADNNRLADQDPKPKPKPPIQLQEVKITAQRPHVAVTAPMVLTPQIRLQVQSEINSLLSRFTPLGRAITLATNLIDLAQNMTLSKEEKSEDVPEGFKETKEFGKPHGQKVYQKGNKYYSKDADGHNGGAWKVFEKQGTRLKRVGTADKNLNIFKK
jgi:RHS repeat-associated protein